MGNGKPVAATGRSVLLHWPYKNGARDQKISKQAYTFVAPLSSECEVYRKKKRGGAIRPSMHVRALTLVDGLQPGPDRVILRVRVNPATSCGYRHGQGSALSDGWLDSLCL